MSTKGTHIPDRLKIPFAGITPALLVAFVWHKVPESERWKEVASRRYDARQRAQWDSSVSQEDRKLITFTFVGLFQRPWLRNTVAATLMSATGFRFSRMAL